MRCLTSVHRTSLGSLSAIGTFPSAASSSSAPDRPCDYPRGTARATSRSRRPVLVHLRHRRPAEPIDQSGTLAHRQPATPLFRTRDRIGMLLRDPSGSLGQPQSISQARVLLAHRQQKHPVSVSQNSPNRVNTAMLLMMCVESTRCLPVRRPRASIIRSVCRRTPTAPRRAPSTARGSCAASFAQGVPPKRASRDRP